MESIIPKCSNNNTCSHVCNVKTCKAIPFLCADDQCSCHSLHQKCISNLKWKIMRQSFSNKLKKSSSELVSYFTQIDDLYKSVIKQIEKSYSQIKNISDNFGLSQLEQQVYQKLKQKKFAELTGELINKVQTELMKDNKQFQLKILEKEKKQIEKQTTILIQTLEGLAKINIKEEGKASKVRNNKNKPLPLPKFDSKITQDFQALTTFFPTKNIEKMNLLYRASENNFQVNKFWDNCDGKKHTIIILKTQFGNIIGGYTPLSWEKSKCNLNAIYQTDNSRQSFLFSLTNKHKLTFMKGQQKQAIANFVDQGPIFGGGNDLWISGKANQNRQSSAIPGFTYNYNNEYEYGTQQSWKKFSGQSNGYKFKIQQWQVHSIVFK